MILVIWMLAVALILTVAVITIGWALNAPGRHRRTPAPHAAAHARTLPAAGKLPAEPDPFEGWTLR